MKSLLYTVILLGFLLIVFFFITSDFEPCNTAAIQTKNAVNTSPVAENTSTPIVEKTTGEWGGNEKERKNNFDKDVNAKSVTETIPVEKPTSEGAYAQTDGRLSMAPAAVPVVTPEHAQESNTEASLYFDKIINEKTNVERNCLARPAGETYDNAGFYLVLKESFQTYKPLAIPEKEEANITRKGYNLLEFKKKDFPVHLSLDFSNLPENATFFQGTDGFEIDSKAGGLVLNAPRYNSMGKSFWFDLTVTNPSDTENCTVLLDINNLSNLIKRGRTHLQQENLHPGETKTVRGYVDIYDQTSIILPTITIKGVATIREFNVYEKSHAEFTVVEGEIEERSSLPKPEDTDYPNCRFTVHFKGNSILSGLPCNKDIQLSVDGFQNKKVLDTNYLKPGDKIQCAIIPVELIPEDLASIQEVDDLSLFTLDSYYASSLYKISSYKMIPSSEQISFQSEVQEYKSVFEEGVNEKIPDFLMESQRERVKKDLIAATAVLNDYEKNHADIEKRFQIAYSKEKERFPGGYNTFKSYIWRNVNHSFWSLPKDYTFVPQELKRLPQSRLDAVAALKDFLEANGVQLIISFVPNWYDISSRVINHDFIDIPDYQSAMYTKQLSEIGVEPVSCG